MSHAAENSPTIAHLIRIYALEQLGRAASILSAVKSLESTDIHETRKAVKRIRAALQLIRSELAERFGAWNGQLRLVNQQLSSARDLDVCRQTVQELIPGSPARHRHVLDRLLTELDVQRTEWIGESSDESPGSPLQILLQVKAELMEPHAEPTSCESIRPAVCRMARQARRLIRKLGSESESDQLHALRKIVKRRLYWLEILQPIWPRGLHAEEKLVDDLADLLGRHHDLEVLAERLRASSVGQESAARGSVVSVARRLVRRQRTLEIRALKLAQRLFAERPKAFARRWMALAKIWQESPPRVDPEARSTGRQESPKPARPR